MRLLIAIISVVLLIIIGIGAYLSPNDLARCDAQPSSRQNCEKADAIVAVSGGSTSSRASEAISLYKEGWANYLIFSGAAKDPSAPSNAAVMKSQALAAGVPEENVLIDENSVNTQDNAEKTNQILQERKITKIILITSPYHQRRAALEFSNILGYDANVRNHPVQNDPDWPKLWWLTPRGLWLVSGESVKLAVTYIGSKL